MSIFFFSVHAAAADVTDWPQLLHHPVIKVSEAVSDMPQLTALASGARSACVRTVDREGRVTWIRLKGCGNHSQGITIRSAPEQGWRDLRGVAFQHTALFECYYTERLNFTMQQFGISSANRALGYFQYGKPDNEYLSSGASAVAAAFANNNAPTPCCVVMKTLGDRRLGSHVLAGIALILDRLVDVDSINVERLKALFPLTRSADVESPTGFVTTDVLMSDHQLAVAIMYFGGSIDNCNGLSFLEPRIPALFADALQTSAQALAERAPDAALLPDQFVQESKSFEPCDVRWATAWRETCDCLQLRLKRLQQRREAGETNLPAALAYLYARIGFECGRFLHVLHRQCGVSWGTYQDAMCHESQMHCNAHSNNMVLIPESEESNEQSSYLAFLDLDMAFDRTSFVDVQTGQLGCSAEAFEKLLGFEHVNFAEVLAGADASSGVPHDAEQRLQALPLGVRALQTVLTDTLIKAYLTAYENPRAVPHAFDQDLFAAGHAIMRLACIAQARFVA
jgi:hypothetical protein